MMQNLLLVLPEDVLKPILEQWLAIHELTCLDSAFCNTANRPSFLRLLSGSNIIFSMPQYKLRRVEAANELVWWSFIRGISMDEMVMTAKVAYEKQFRQKFFKQKGKTIRLITFNKRQFNYSSLPLDIQRWCTSLEELHFMPDVMSHPDPAWDKCLLAFTKTCTTLKTLRIVNTIFTTDGLAAALAHCQSLKSLTLTSQKFKCEITETVAIPTLTYLNLRHSYVTDPIARAIGANCPNLQTFLCFEGNEISDTGTMAVVEGCPLLTHTDVVYGNDLSQAVRLRLAMEHKPRRFVAYHWDAETAPIVLSACPEITHLELEHTDDTNAMLAMCAQHCPSSLKHVDLTRCWFDATDLEALLQVAPKLRTINLSEIDVDEDDAMILAIACHCPLLKGLSCPVTVLSVEAVEAIKHGCPKLRGITIDQEDRPAEYFDIGEVARYVCEEQERREREYYGLSDDADDASQSD